GCQRAFDHPLHDAVQERALRLEVVVESALRSIQVIEDILDAGLLVALDLDEPLGRVEERVPSDGMSFWIERPCHVPPFLRPTVGLRITPGAFALQVVRVLCQARAEARSAEARISATA